MKWTLYLGINIQATSLTNLIGKSVKHTSESRFSDGFGLRIGAAAVGAGPPVLLLPKIKLLIPIDFFFSMSAISPITILTRAYSIKDKNTNTVHPDIKTSMALIYETGGSDFWLLACWVDRVSKLVTPKVTRAGTASGLIQKDIQDMITIKQVGTYVWKR